MAAGFVGSFIHLRSHSQLAISHSRQVLAPAHAIQNIPHRPCIPASCAVDIALDGMKSDVPRVSAVKPTSLSGVEVDDFVSFVLAGGEVTGQGLRSRVLRAECITFLREAQCLLGVGGLKRPSTNHRKDVEAGASVTLGAKQFPLELGWVFILPSARGRKLSLPLCEPLVAAAANRGVFATSREEKKGMHATLVKLGFERVGDSWPSVENDGNLFLFTRNAVVKTEITARLR